MPSRSDFDDAGLVHVGAAVSVPHGHRRQRPQRVNLRQGGGGALDAGSLGHDFFPEPGKQLVFQRHNPL
ncbi:hypothetical protein SDC9_142983 [bioreactor metagenome]|uniref:Uncharacterized protein n=1 Tax=bioreactor metagenome TaxID=1076179 RepID=A0A645E362_9ZZZZ